MLVCSLEETEEGKHASSLQWILHKNLTFTHRFPLDSRECPIQNEMETASKHSLLVRSENCARRRAGILANNFLCHHSLRLDVIRLHDNSGKTKPRNITPENPAGATG